MEELEFEPKTGMLVKTTMGVGIVLNASWSPWDYELGSIQGKWNILVGGNVQKLFLAEFDRM
tara:strand:- start:765 stop:950 length:186 start_codon:yes stop_codon:yes gene_type:complete